METQTQTPPVRAAAETIEHYYHDGEEYIRHNPTQSALVAMAVGLLLAQLPLRYMMLALLKLILLLVKPATFIYATCKLVDDIRGNRSALR